MMTIASLCLAFTGFCLLALAMPRHRDQMLGKGVPGRRQPYARPLGWLLLGLSLVTCAIDHGWSMGSVWWLGVVTAAAAPIVLALTYRPRMLMPLLLCAPLVAGAASLLS